MTLFDSVGGSDALPPRRISLVKLSSLVAGALADIGTIAVEGEVHQPVTRGSVYFTLKDRAATMRVWCPQNRLQHCRTVAGERVLVTGSLSYDVGRGSFSLRASEVVPVGAGAVAALLSEVRERLRAAGLLDRARRDLPLVPRGVGVVCGAEAAVRRDIEAVTAERFAGFPVHFVEVRVSGAGAAEAMAEAVAALAARPDIDVIILARGGGDATELLPFSDEVLCRAVAGSPVPVVTAVGHEGDRPLCDEVADLRCGTPSMAAAAVVPDRAELDRRLDRALLAGATVLAGRAGVADQRLARSDPAPALRTRAERERRRVERAGDALAFAHPGRALSSARRLLATVDWEAPLRARVGRVDARLAELALRAEALSPQRVLERGYAVVRTPGGEVVRDATTLSSGATIDVRLAAGALRARVEEVRR